jgi:hypothetical protein
MFSPIASVGEWFPIDNEMIQVGGFCVVGSCKRSTRAFRIWITQLNMAEETPIGNGLALDDGPREYNLANLPADGIAQEADGPEIAP